MPNSRLSKENAVLLLQNTIVREKFDLQAWDIRQMKANVFLMKSIVEKAKWGSAEKPMSLKLKWVLGELETIIQERDATRVDAGHTHVEQVFSELRKIVFGI